MKKQYFFLVFTMIFLGCGKGVFAQIVGTNGFLQGAWLEIGETRNGSFGVSSGVPAAYHTHIGGPTWTSGGPLAEVYDYGHDGWSVGTPPLMGDYTRSEEHTSELQSQR